MTQVLGILRSMALLKAVYDLTKYVHNTQDLDTEEKLGYSYPLVNPCEQYAAIKHMPLQRATEVYNYALHKKYVIDRINSPSSDTPDQRAYKVVIDNAGVHFLNKSLFGIWPKGLVQAWVEENYKTSTVIMTFLGGIIIGLLPYIVKLIHHLSKS